MRQLIAGLLGRPLGAVYPFWSTVFQGLSGLLDSAMEALYLALFRSARILKRLTLGSCILTERDLREPELQATEAAMTQRT